MRVALILICSLLALQACVRDKALPTPETPRPTRQLNQYFDSAYHLYKLPGNYYKQPLNASFNFNNGSYENVDMACGAQVSFYPMFGYSPQLSLQYSHIYSPKCVYHTADTIWNFAQVCFPNTCLTNNAPALAHIKLKNTSGKDKTFWLKMFYQNTSYWYATDSSMDYKNAPFIDNYYGQGDKRLSIFLPAGKDTNLVLPYSIGMDPKSEDWDHTRHPARPGNYEFALLVLDDTLPSLMNHDYWLQKSNPFAEMQRDQLENKGNTFVKNIAYVGPQHFKFVFLEEFFDGSNDLTPNHIYIPKYGTEKRLCDTCTGYFKNVISEHWLPDDFFKGFIDKAPFVKAEYGMKRENTVINSNGITLKIPASSKDSLQKTWGEFWFGQAFKYGHLTVRAKFAQMMNASGTPNGIIHNLWLYQRDHDPVDTTNPYSYLRDPLGFQHYEIDFEIWSSVKESQVWDDDALINYSIVDYMRDPNVKVKPGEEKQMGQYTVDRLNNRQLNLPSKQFDRSFFEQFHTYELIWSPQQVRFLLDGKEEAVITPDMAKIPDKYLFLWIGSPIYQDGTYYSQIKIPFLEKDKQSVIDYIKIE
jgi:hypothetical protein